MCAVPEAWMGEATSSKIKGSVLRPLWYSRAALHSDIQDEFPDLVLRNGDIHGAGIDRSRELSQQKAISEMIERLAYLKYSKESPQVAGLTIDPSTTGFACLPRSFDVSDLFETALCEALERWATNEVFYNNSICLVAKTSKFRKRRHYTAEISVQKKVWHYHLVIRPLHKGFTSGVSLSANPRQAKLGAEAELENHLHKWSRWQSGAESPNPHDLLEKRFAAYIENSALANEYLEKLGRCKANSYTEPKVTLKALLQGPWEEFDYQVARVMVGPSESIALGGTEKMML